MKEHNQALGRNKSKGASSKLAKKKKNEDFKNEYDFLVEEKKNLKLFQEQGQALDEYLAMGQGHTYPSILENGIDFTGLLQEEFFSIFLSLSILFPFLLILHTQFWKSKKGKS